MSGVLYDSKVHAWLHSGAKQRLGRAARYRDADLRPILREKRSIIFYPNGSFIRIQGSDDYEPYESKQKPRGKIGGFSAKSRGRLMSVCAQLNRNAVALFLTLTWPGVWNPDPETWKTCLDTFLKRLVRAHPECSGIWKLEPQERGAPHYHLLLFGVDFIPHLILAQWWYEIVGSGDERHLQAGIRIEAVRSREGVMHYASKLYMGKEIAGFEGVGRFWGVFNRKKLPISRKVKAEISAAELVYFQRMARRYIQTKQKESFLAKRRQGKTLRWRPYRCNRPARIFCNDPAQWVRLLEWAAEKFTEQQIAKGHPF
jgi:hypothetical protein